MQYLDSGEWKINGTHKIERNEKLRHSINRGEKCFYEKIFTWCIWMKNICTRYVMTFHNFTIVFAQCGHGWSSVCSWFGTPVVLGRFSLFLRIDECCVSKCQYKNIESLTVTEHYRYSFTIYAVVQMPMEIYLECQRKWYSFILSIYVNIIFIQWT